MVVKKIAFTTNNIQSIKLSNCLVNKQYMQFNFDGIDDGDISASYSYYFINDINSISGKYNKDELFF